MISNLYGNPHSKSDPAHLSGQEVDDVREEALRFFGADPEQFDLIFTANATAAIKLVADSFRDLASTGTPSGTFWYGKCSQSNWLFNPKS
jgi:molybdenum cofactor sulfurtransferase